jgi:dsDNA-specific endonuclease/ATPase MutS2
MDRNNPLDFMLTEGKASGALFGDSDVNEIMLPDMDYEEKSETPAEEASETPEKETDEELDTLSKELKELKDKLDELKVKYPEDTNAEVASALDDATSAIDLAVHHLDDIGEDLRTEEKPLMGEIPGGEAPPALENELPVLPPEGI